MLTKKDLLPLIKKNNLLTIEVDDRHLELINEILSVGYLIGLERAKNCIRWRIDGEMWCNFIDEGITQEDFQDADAEAA